MPHGREGVADRRLNSLRCTGDQGPPAQSDFGRPPLRNSGAASGCISGSVALTQTSAAPRSTNPARVGSRYVACLATRHAYALTPCDPAHRCKRGVRRRVRLSVLSMSTSAGRLTSAASMLSGVLRGDCATRCSDDGTNTAPVHCDTSPVGCTQFIALKALTTAGSRALLFASDSSRRRGARGAPPITPYLAWQHDEPGP